MGDDGNLTHELHAPLAMLFDLVEEAARGPIEIPQLDLSVQRRRCSRLLHSIEQLIDVQSTEASRPHNKRTTETFEARIKRSIDLHMHEDTFDVAALAKMALLSRAQLHRRLMATSGCSPSELIRAQRLDHARNLIAQPGGTISEIAYAVGFVSLDGFTRAFHHRFRADSLRVPPALSRFQRSALASRLGKELRVTEHVVGAGESVDCVATHAGIVGRAPFGGTDVFRRSVAFVQARRDPWSSRPIATV